MSNRRKVTICEGNSTQYHGWTTWEESQLVKTLARPVKPTQCTVIEHILGVSVWSWRIMSEHGIQTKIITETPKVSLAKVENQNNLDHWVWSTKHLCLKDKEYAVNSMYSCYESYCSRFWEWNYNSERKLISSLYTTMPLLILHNNKVLPRKSQCGEDRPPYSLNLAPANCSCSLKWKPPSKDKALRTLRTSRRIYRPN
jgi:hypothetical protein